MVQIINASWQQDPSIKHSSKHHTSVMTYHLAKHFVSDVNRHERAVPVVKACVDQA